MSQYYLGIDASKGYADFVLLDEQHTPIGRGFQLDDTFRGHQYLHTYLQQVVTQHPTVTIAAALESTGGYENNWYRCLSALSPQLPIKVARLNPAWVKSNSDARGTRTRTDQISAKDVAEYLLAHPEKVIYNEPEERAAFRRMWSHIQLMIKQKSQALSHLESVLYSSMPELLSYCRQGMPQWLLQLLTICSTYEQLRRMPDVHIPYFPKKKAQKLLARIEHGIGDSGELSGQIVSSLATQILALDEQIKSEKKYLQKQCASDEQVKVLRSFKCIGVYSAVGLLVYIGDVSRFSSSKKLASYFGVHPVWKKSGDDTWGNHMSKQGAAAVRAILYMIALSGVRHNPLIKELYANCCAKGMKKSAALGICMHKILRIVFGMLTHNTSFDPEIHRKHSERTALASSHLRPHSKVESRIYDEDAPISRRQNKRGRNRLSPKTRSSSRAGSNSLHPPSCSVGNSILKNMS